MATASATAASEGARSLVLRIAQALPIAATCQASGEASVGRQRLHAQNPAVSAAAGSGKKRTFPAAAWASGMRIGNRCRW